MPQESQTDRRHFRKGTAKNRGLPTETRIGLDRRAVRKRPMPVVGRGACAHFPPRYIQRSPTRAATMPPSCVGGPAIVEASSSPTQDPSRDGRFVESRRPSSPPPAGGLLPPPAAAPNDRAHADAVARGSRRDRLWISISTKTGSDVPNPAPSPLSDIGDVHPPLGR